MAAETSRSSGAADSYIGSLISLTSKCEIRYEGILYNINTEESSIGLRNVRAFGTEGRKKDGPQIPASDKVYEYILFRGTDIKDLQVKSSPPAQTSAPIHNDPAIIQSHYSRPPAVSTSLPSAGSGSTPDPASHSAQLGLPRSTFQGGLPLYPPGGNLASWGSTPAPPNANGSGLAMPPMYWPGFYGPAGGLPPHLQQQQQPLLRPPPGLPIPPSMQQPMQYPGLNTTSFPNNSQNLPEFPSPLLLPVSLPTTGGSYSSLTSSGLPSSVGHAQAAALASETFSALMSNKAPVTSLTTTPTANLPMVSPLTSSNLDINPIVPPISSKVGARAAPGPALPSQPLSQSIPTVGPSTSSHTETLVVPLLVTPGQILQPVPSTAPPSQPLTKVNKDLETVQSALPEPSSSTVAETQAPILPLPTVPNRKVNGTALPVHYGSRGRGRGRGNGISHAVTKFTEDFDFNAMNEKFKKDEVWGHLGKSKGLTEDGKDDDVYNNLEEDELDASKLEVTPVYVKDDFFDSLSCNALDRGARNGRTRFSEQMKIDTETFGEFDRHRGGRGGRGSGRGGRGRGYYGRGYGYVGRGRGQTLSSRTNY
ncbi:protein decapping 5 isoform X2 [Aristolochia californica]|uniref:protein decapping 5 isoform X2 n=1 Tax=Aristolochia californica TaxID=171875 RepID=UPI0035D66A87